MYYVICTHVYVNKYCEYEDDIPKKLRIVLYHNSCIIGFTDIY